MHRKMMLILFIFLILRFCFCSYVEKMATEICDVDDVVKETSSYSTTDSHMPLIDDLRSETATTSNHVYSLNNDNEEGK